MRIFDATMGKLEQALDARGLRHVALTGNLANANTPGFQPRDVDFDAAMAQAAQARGEASAAAPGPGSLSAAGEIPLEVAGGRVTASASPIVAGQGNGAGLDGNAVDVDRALVAVAENALQYGATAKAAGKKLAILRYAASDGAA